MRVEGKDYWYSDEEMINNYYKKYKRVLLTDEDVAFGDMLRIYSSIGRWRTICGGDVEFFFLGNILKHQGIALSEYHCNGFNQYSPINYCNEFSGSLITPIRLDSDVIVNDSIVYYKKIVDYIEYNNIEVFYYYNFPNIDILGELLSKRSINCDLICSSIPYCWGLGSKLEYLRLRNYCISDGIKRFVDSLSKPRIIYHCRQRGWNTYRNPSLNSLYYGCEQINKVFGGSVLRIGVKDRYYTDMPLYNGYYELADMILTFDEQCYLISQCDVAIDIHSVLLTWACELGIPALHIDKVDIDCPNVVKDLYYTIEKDIHEDKSSSNEIYDKISHILNTQGNY